MPETDYLASLVKPIVDNPGSITIDRKVDEMGVLLTLRADPKDVPLLIGKQGKTALSIKHLLRIYGAKNKSRVSLQIISPTVADQINSRV